jgi:outer membrane receptor protein involved in Fe transport
VQDPLHSEITIKAYDNLGKATNTGIELAFDQKVTKFWNLSATANIYRNTIFAHSGIIKFPVNQTYSIGKRTDTPMFAKISSQFTLPQNFRIEFNGIWFSAKNIGQGKELSRGGLDLGLRKAFANNKLEINLSGTDIFNTMGIRQKIESTGFNVEYQNFYETQVFSLGIKYKF